MTALSRDAFLGLLRESGALLEGHFLLSSGLHSPFYLQCARLLMDPRRAERVSAALCTDIRNALPHVAFDAVVTPALGGVVLGHEIARQLDTLAMFVERDGGRFTLRRGFTLEAGARVLVAEDVVTTGLSTRECIEVVRDEGGEVAAAACLVDRSGGRAQLDVPLIALARLDLPVYAPDALPADLADRPAIKPGSRPAKTVNTRPASGP